MEAGKVFQELPVMDGHKVTLRAPKWKGFDDPLGIISARAQVLLGLTLREISET
jgi:hypothetical protein